MSRADGPPAKDRSSDLPLLDPELDLLGIAQHAEVLAQHVLAVPTPFTIGIYGEWGAGKTTFVNFMKHYLGIGPTDSADAPAFVHFEAWQHRTADELWRALTIEIARAVYSKRYSTESFDLNRRQSAGPNGSSNGKSTSLQEYLAGDAVILRREKDDPTPEHQFRELVRRLDSTMYGGIAKSTQDAPTLDQDQVVIAAMQASMAALGATSPLFAALRRLAGGKLGDAEKIDLSSAFRREQNEATRDRIESKREFQNVLTDLLGILPEGVRLCVFLDDLDRCMPDVALDLLEAVKIFLDVKNVVFVVAADENLIGKGLRIRYKELLQVDASPTERDFLARKGEEYFEKIIQLRINLPDCSPQNGHRFIAAQFPEWMPATDIILAAVGSNPRRLKQYCSWLAFRWGVDQMVRRQT